MTIRRSYYLDEHTKSRLELLRALATFSGEDISLSALLNRSVDEYFARVYDEYSKTAPESDMVLLALRRMLPDGYQGREGGQTTDRKRFKHPRQSCQRSFWNPTTSPPPGPDCGAGHLYSAWSEILLPAAAMSLRRLRSRLPGGSLTLSPPVSFSSSFRCLELS